MAHRVVDFSVSAYATPQESQYSQPQAKVVGQIHSFLILLQGGLPAPAGREYMDLSSMRPSNILDRISSTGVVHLPSARIEDIPPSVAPRKPPRLPRAPMEDAP